MGGAQGGYLGQMGDADNLALTAPHLLHDLGHLLGYLATDTRVDLVEDDGGQFDSPADHGFQGEHDAGNLATRSHLRDRLEWGGGVGTEQEGYLVLSAGTEVGGGNVDVETYMGHAQRYESGLHILLNLTGCLGAQLGE